MVVLTGIILAALRYWPPGTADERRLRPAAGRRTEEFVIAIGAILDATNTWWAERLLHWTFRDMPVGHQWRHLPVPVCSRHHSVAGMLLVRECP
jgi:hypothetical protein